MVYLELIGGIIVLLISGRLLVSGGVELAKKLKISSLVIGMTVVAFGTSAPELLVSISAALKGSPEISLGNVIGSNIANIGLVLALTALIFPIPVQKDTVKFDWPIMLAATILLFALILKNVITRFEGFILFALLIAYITWEIHHSRKQMKKLPEPEPAKMSTWLALLLIIISSVGLAKGADWLVNSAIIIAKKLHISQRIISITVIAIGTSLPELTASLIAAFKKVPDISVGNIIGSNIFNILSIIGLTAIIHPLHFSHKPFLFDLSSLMIISILLGFFIFPFKHYKITRIEGLFLLLAYLSYMVALFYIKF